LRLSEQQGHVFNTQVLLDFFLIFVTNNLGFGIFELSPISFSIHLFKKVCRKK
jgi:hypothetical protein